jgi:hypothetical protein
VDCTINTSTSKQPFVCRIHYRIDLEGSDVGTGEVYLSHKLPNYKSTSADDLCYTKPVSGIACKLLALRTQTSPSPQAQASTSIDLLSSGRHLAALAWTEGTETGAEPGGGRQRWI